MQPGAEDAFAEIEKASVAGTFLMSEKPATQHRGQGQGYEAGNQDGGADGNGKFVQQTAYDSAMNSNGMNTAASDSVMERMVKPISLAPSMAASIGFLPISMWRTMFSSMTMASSTTNPTDRVRAINDKLSRL